MRAADSQQFDIIGMILFSNRFWFSAKDSSLFTHIEFAELGESATTNQSRRCSAAPISSCHC